jgi:hypothetical protein
MAADRGLPISITDERGTRHRLDVAHQLGLRRALSILERRGLVVRAPGGWLGLTEDGARCLD